LESTSQILIFNELFRKLYPLESLVENVNLKAAKIELERKKKEDPKFGDNKNSALTAGSAFFKKKALGNIVGSDNEE
jgi:hypothetical protein